MIDTPAIPRATDSGPFVLKGTPRLVSSVVRLHPTEVDSNVVSVCEPYTLLYQCIRGSPASPSQRRRHPPSTPHRPGRRDWGWHHLITAVSSTRLLIGEAARIVNFAIVEEISAVLSQMRTEAAR